MRSISSELLRLFLVHSTLLFLTANCTYRFSEELLVDPLHDSFVQFYFEFKSDLEINHSNFVENYELFPKRIGDIAKKFEINELSLKLSQGTWRYEEWGSPITSAPSGGELWARFESENQDQVDSNWLKSSRAISGLFGLSINLEENPNTIIPKHTNISDNIRYASIPNEIVCTENLTPWLKLLPCGSYKGLAQLFKSSPRLFESHYFMARLHFIRICMDEKCTIEKLELRQTLTVVYDINSIIRQMTTDQLSYSFSNVFLKTIDGFCPVAYLSKVYVNLRNDAVAISLPSNEQFYSEIMKSKVDVFDLIELFKTSREFNPMINQKRVKTTLKSIVSIHRYITDINERNFGLKTLIRNDFSERLSIVYLDAIPWYFRVYISTLVVMDEKKNIWIKPDVVHFVPGLDRKRPHHIELKLNLEPKSVYSIYFKAEFAYLKWDEFPPDVNHGFYITPAVVEIDFNDNLKHLTHYRYPYLSTNIYENLKYKFNTNRNMKIYSETLLMNLPTPDFSMPYNVICLTCTVIAIGFGSIHNFTTRRFIFLESKSLKDKIRGFFKRGQ